MTVPLEKRVGRLTSQLISQRARLTLLEVAVNCLFTTHPHPERLRAAFEPAGKRVLERAIDSRLIDEVLSDVRDLYQTLLGLIDKAPRDPPDHDLPV